MERREIELWYLESFSTNNKPVNIVGANETDIWPLAGELREIIVAKSRRAGGAHWWGRTAKTTAKIIHTGKTHWKISHHSGTLITSSKKREEGRPSKLKNRKEALQLTKKLEKMRQCETRSWRSWPPWLCLENWTLIVLPKKYELLIALIARWA